MTSRLYSGYAEPRRSLLVAVSQIWATNAWIRDLLASGVRNGLVSPSEAALLVKGYRIR